MGKKLLLHIIILFVFCTSSNAQHDAVTYIWVLFPLAKDVQQIPVVKDKNGDYVYGGDIVIDTSQIIIDTSGRGNRPIDELLRLKRQMYRQKVHFLNLQNTNTNLWQDNIMPYVIEDSFGVAVINVINYAINDVNTNTNLMLRPKIDGDRNWVVFKIKKFDRNYSGSSMVGRVSRRGGQTIRLTNNSIPNGVVTHEILHAAGFLHEHSRPDRDDYITIVWNNVKTIYRHNLWKEQNSEIVTPYDYRSIMHYANTAYGKIGLGGEPKITIIPKEPDSLIGYTAHLSRQDIAGVNSVYTRFVPPSVDNRPTTTPPFKICKPGEKYCPSKNKCILKNKYCPPF